MAAEQTTREGDAAAAAASAEGAAAAPAKPVAAKPVGGIGLGISAIWSIIANFFRKLFGLKPKS